MENTNQPTIRTLRNGLTVIAQPVAYAPVAACVIAYRAAPLWETEGSRGLSHFCEHMMFRGTGSISGTRFWQIVQRDGGISNAFTSKDMTAYYAVVPNGRLDDILRIEADRMVGCIFDPSAVKTEKRVVLEERMMTHLDNPSGALAEELYRTAFTIHPYRHPATGYSEDIEGFSRDSAYAFYRNFYTPPSCLIVLTGRIDAEQALDQTESIFGDIEGTETVKGTVPCEPAQTCARITGIRHSSSMQRVIIAFAATRASDPQNPLLDLVTMHLAGGRTGRLEEKLVQSGMATDVSASNGNSRDRGLFTLETGLLPGGDTEEVLKVISAEIESLREEPLPEERMGSLRRRYMAMQAMTVSSPAGLALEYAMDWCITDDPFASDRAEEIVRNATAEEFMKTVQDNLTEDKTTVARLLPDSSIAGRHHFPGKAKAFVPDVTPPSMMDFEGLEIDERLLAVPAHSISEGAIDEVFPNGLRILLRQDHSFPLVSIAFAVPMGSSREPPGMAGLTAVTSESMHYGTDDMNYMNFNGMIESIGAELRFGGGSEHSTGHLTMLSDDVHTGLGIIDRLLRKPAFRREDIGQVLQEARSEVEIRKDIPFAVSLDRLARMMTEPEEMARIPTEETLSDITRESVGDFHRTCVRPDGSVVVIVGDITPDEVMEELHHLFDAWENPSSPLTPLNHGIDSVEPATTVARMKGMTQTAVTIGFPAPARDSADRSAFHLLNAILGDGIGSRLGRTIRDERGLAYSVGSEYFTGQSKGRFLAYLSTSPADAWKALGAMRAEIDNLVSLHIDPVELQLAKASSMGRHTLGLMHYHNVANYLLLAASTGRPLDQDIVNLRKIAQMEADILKDVAARWLGEREPFVSLAGDLPADE